MWILYALVTSLVWGFDYVLAEKILKKISPASLMFFELLFAAIIVFIFSLFSGKLAKDISIVANSRQTGIYLLFGVLTFALANVLSFYAIQAKNATLASIIEVSYPLFIIIIAWVLFRESALNISVIIGGLLIFAGIFIISYFNK